MPPEKLRTASDESLFEPCQRQCPISPPPDESDEPDEPVVSSSDFTFGSELQAQKHAATRTAAHKIDKVFIAFDLTVTSPLQK